MRTWYLVHYLFFFTLKAATCRFTCLWIHMCGASAKISVSLAACPEQCLMIRKANVQYGIVCSLYNHWAIINTCTLGSKYISRFLVSFSQRFDWRQMLFHSSGFRSCHFLPRCEIEVEVLLFSTGNPFWHLSCRRCKDDSAPWLLYLHSALWCCKG